MANEFKLVKLLDPAVNININVHPRGEYDEAITYLVGDMVTFQGSLYIAKKETTGNLPTDTNFWKFLFRIQSEFQSFEKIVDANDVITKTFELNLDPLNNSEIFILNGLAQDSSCYTINGTQLILVPSFDLKLNDNVIIKYAT